MQQTLAPEVPLDKAVPRLSRSPHPYNRKGTNETFTLSHNGAHLGPFQGQHTDFNDSSSLPTQEEIAEKRKASEVSSSGTEDEAIHQHKALPPTPLDMRKGLRLPPRSNGSDATPLLTPSALYEEEERLNKGYFEHAEHDTMSQDNMDKARAKFHARRRAELLRRACEVLLLLGIVGIVLNGREVWEHMVAWSSSKHVESRTRMAVDYLARHEIVVDDHYDLGGRVSYEIDAGLTPRWWYSPPSTSSNTIGLRSSTASVSSDDSRYGSLLDRQSSCRAPQHHLGVLFTA